MPGAPTRRRDLVAKLFDEKHSVKDIATKLKITTNTVYQHLSRAGRQVRDHRVAACFEILAELLNTKDSYQAIGKRLGVSRQRVQQVAEKARESGIVLWERDRAKAV